MRSRWSISLRLGIGAALVLAACRDNQQSPSGRTEAPGEDLPEASTLATIDLVYICGNKFLATNSTRSPVAVTYRVVGTNETGSLTLPEPPGEGDPWFSETELETVERGTVELYLEDDLATRRRNQGLPCGASAPSFAIAAGASSAPAGQWGAPFSWPHIAVHLSLLPTGKVLSFGLSGTPGVWNPVDGGFTSIPSPAVIFCAGHSYLADGRLLISGGNSDPKVGAHGIPDNTIFDPATQSFSRSTPMRYARWYPTNTTLANGEVLILAGRDGAGVNVREHEIWSNGALRRLSTALLALPLYPRAFLAPDGRVFVAGETRATRYLDPTGTGSWITGPSRLYGVRDYGAAVMYDHGKILYVGGGRTTNTAEIIDLNSAAPAWKWTGSMAFARRHLNAIVLPTGEVLVTGGTSGITFNDYGASVRAAELWNPATGVWTRLASNAVNRVYHSSSILLPDGRVLHSGSGDGGPNQRNAELFSPPYLFKGPRPTITASPSGVAYGTSFNVTTPNAADISKVSLIRLGSTTHAFDMNQRFQWLSFTRQTGALVISPITSRNRTPPGHYMLFILNRDAVPSVAKIIRVGSSGNSEPPPSNKAPSANFSYSCSGLTCGFTDASTDGDGTVTAWTWNFGDGTGSSARNPSRTYTGPGTYTVALTATDDDGAKGSASKQVTLSAPPSSINLAATGRSDATTQYITLIWTGAAGTMVDVYRNGVLGKTTENDGRYVNARQFVGAATYRYKVCQAGSTVCSNEVTVVFK